MTVLDLSLIKHHVSVATLLRGPSGNTIEPIEPR